MAFSRRKGCKRSSKQGIHFDLKVPIESTSLCTTCLPFPTPSPLAQIAEIDSALGNFTNTTVAILQGYWDGLLGSSPKTFVSYATNSTTLPAIFKEGGFATQLNPGFYPPAVCGALYSVGINALWNLDGAFVVKISDATLGQGAGAACNGNAQKGLVANSCGADGSAYIFMRWVFSDNTGFQICSQYPCITEPQMNLDRYSWQVWGAYNSTPFNPTGNTDNLKQYGLDLNQIALSSVRVQANLGFWAQDTLGLIRTEVDDNIQETLTTNQLQAWNMVVCDLDAFSNGTHLDPSLGVCYTVIY